MAGLQAGSRPAPGTAVSAADLAAAALPEHLRLNLRVLASTAGAAPHALPQVLAEGRDLAQLRRQLRRPARVSAATGETWRNWEFGLLPEVRPVLRSGVSFNVWPALRDVGAGVSVVEARSLAEATDLSRGGLTRLAVLALPQLARHVARRIADERALILLAQGLAGHRTLRRELHGAHFSGMLLRRRSGTAPGRTGLRGAPGSAPRGTSTPSPRA